MAIDTKLGLLRSVVRLDSNQWKSERALTAQDTLVTAAAAASTGSVYTIVRVPTRARIHGGGTVVSTGAPAFSIGLKPAGGAVFTQNNTAISPARTLVANTATPIIADITRRGLMVWELLGLTADPDAAADIVLVLTADFTAGGPIATTIHYSVD